jgi:hypothetical protein
MEGRAATDRDLRADGIPAWLLGLVPLLLIVAAIGVFTALGGPGLGERRGPPAEELAVEKTVLQPGTIELTVRNDGPDAVSIAQAQVNDAFVQFSGADEPIGRLETATVRLQQPCSRRRAGRSRTTSRSPWRRPPPTSPSSASWRCWGSTSA